MNGQSIERQTMINFPTRRLQKSDLDVSDSNQHVLTALENWKNWSSKYVCITGDHLSGKSTLAQYWADTTVASFITGTDLSGLTIDRISYLATKRIVVDDAGHCNNENALLSLLNLLDEQACAVLILECDPKDANFDSRDLKSRLTSVPTFAINVPDEEMLRLRLRTAGRRFFMRFSDSVLDYLVPRIPRNYEFLENYVQELSDVVGDFKRRPTVPLAADVLEKIQTND